MSNASGRIRSLGEVALRVRDLDRMQDFYENVLGLPLMKRFEQAAFFKIADGFEGDTQIPLVPKLRLGTELGRSSASSTRKQSLRW